MEILLEPTSNKLMVEHAEFDESNANVLERFYTLAGNPVKETLLKLNLPDHSDKVLKLKYFKKDATLKLFKSTNQERYEHVGLEVTSSQDDKVYKMAKQDYAWLMISRCSKSHSSQDKGISSNLKVNDHYIKSQAMIEVERAQD
ncbi:hypothetical protein Tco_1218672 [Tanacetum coccineum]